MAYTVRTLLCALRDTYDLHTHLAGFTNAQPALALARGLVERTLTCSVSQVQDISGGCGSMYAIEIESSRFAGLTVIKQHKLVNQVLKEEIAGWHGVQLRTKAA
jgi:stress-induced morphogen